MTTSSQAEGLAGWLRLAEVPGIGPVTARALLSRFGLPETIFQAGYRALLEVVSDKVASAVAAPLSPATQTLIGKTLEWAAQDGNHVLTLADAAYPAALLEIADPPLVLYAKGRTELLSARSIAIVGSRNATAQGMIDGERFAAHLSQAGVCVVSGLALGIDTAAHRGGLKGSGSTVAVIGTGIDIVYPSRNRALAHEIAAAGCIVSEYPLGTPSIASNFPRRNRIISGLAAGVLVVEAAAQSGSLITARMAADQGRDVFALPGSIHSPLSKGCHELIRQGAKLVDSVQDILEELGESAAAMRASDEVLPPAHGGKLHPVLEALQFAPVDFDQLALRCGQDAASLSAALLELEMAGSVEALPGGLYRRLG